VLKVNQIVVDAPAEMLTNAAGPPGGYKFSVRFRFVMLISFLSSTFLLIKI
jgi:hypothetical protein